MNPDVRACIRYSAIPITRNNKAALPPTNVFLFFLFLVVAGTAPRSGPKVFLHQVLFSRTPQSTDLAGHQLFGGTSGRGGLLLEPNPEAGGGASSTPA